MIYIVTGVSRGLGKAIAELYLDKGCEVIGIGRSNTISASNFSFIECDLSSIDQVKKLKFNAFSGAVTLINNAGIIGDIKRLSDQSIPDIQHVIDVNVTAPTIITSLVYNQVANKDLFSLVNISSGAGRRAIPSWAAYCASKAALNMVSETFLLEELEKGNSPKVYAVSPGVLDTDMQSQIRQAKEEEFSAVENFVELKEKGELLTPKEVAIRLDSLLNSTYTNEVLCDLRSFSD